MLRFQQIIRHLINNAMLACWNKKIGGLSGRALKVLLAGICAHIRWTMPIVEQNLRWPHSDDGVMIQDIMLKLRFKIN